MKTRNKYKTQVCIIVHLVVNEKRSWLIDLFLIFYLFFNQRWSTQLITKKELQYEQLDQMHTQEIITCK